LEPQIIEIKILPEHASDPDRLEKKLALELGLPDLKGYSYTILRKSLDARGKPITFLYRVQITKETKQVLVPVYTSLNKSLSQEAVIIGFGPAGIFAALELLSLGIKPIVLERGKKVKERRRDLMEIYRNRNVLEDSNYCFGEGGAGTFSDGKLYTRSKKRGDIDRVLRAFVEHGAKPNILFEAHPHIGTNKLPSIVEQLRDTIERNGGEVRFDTRVTDIQISNGRIQNVVTNKGDVTTNTLILATGHSARDIFELLENRSVEIEAKPFALGVRIEHPQSYIDRARYKVKTRGEYLPPASYSLVHQVNGRGVFSFCMCPGGIIAPSMTTSNEVVVNGWSPSKRNGEFANSGLVVQVMPEDWEVYSNKGKLAALEYQRVVERKAFEAGGGDLSAPAQRASDFVTRRQSTTLPDCSYIPGVASADLSEVLPKEMSDRIREALGVFNKKIPGYACPEAIMVGVESRTSSPVRIPRDKQSLMHTSVDGLYPCGEGAGYAGGIMSAALDGIACARALAEKVLKSG
jgi:uncharacterized protein